MGQKKDTGRVDIRVGRQCLAWEDKAKILIVSKQLVRWNRPEQEPSCQFVARLSMLHTGHRAALTRQRRVA